MTNYKNISFVFILIICLLIGLGGFSLFYLDRIAQKTELLYKHPYTVSNAVRNIDTNIVAMHRYMKDVALADDAEGVKQARSLVDAHEVAVLENFQIVLDRYLGLRSDIDSAYQSFIGWKVIRDEVIQLKTDGMDKEAAYITRNKGADYVKQLTDETKKLIDYADNKAIVFLENSRESRDQSFIYIIGLLSAAVFFSVFLSYYTVRRLISAQSEIAKRMELIDQNILMANMDKNGVIEDISNHLCRYLKVTKKEMKGQQVNFFIDPEVSDINTDDIYKLIETGKPWIDEIELLDISGHHQWIKSAVLPNIDADNNLVGFTNIIEDITNKKAVEKLSITDALTKLHNRRHFDDVIDKVVKISRRNRVPVAFAMIDIDYFKNFNDQYGHAAGDSALIEVASVFKKTLRRPNDYIFRIGGEEFGIILSNTDSDKCAAVLEAIRSKVENLCIEHVGSEVSRYITISIGAIFDIDNAFDSSDLYSKADELLYKAKINRNTVIVG